MTRETLDEALDRVASGMTTVPADPAFATRLRPRLLESSPITTSVMAACGAAVVLAFAVGVSVSVFWSAERNVGRLPEMVAANTAVEATGKPARIAPGGPSPPPPPATDPAHERSMVGLDRSAASEPVPPAIAALPAPPVLDLAHLQLEPLAVEPVDVSSLEIPVLALTGIGTTNDQGK